MASSSTDDARASSSLAWLRSFLMAPFSAFLPTTATTRTGKLVCRCGAVEYALNVPPSSYAIVEQTNAVCHCTDCVGFCVALCADGNNHTDEHEKNGSDYNSDKLGRPFLTSNQGSHLVQFYKSDLTLVKGRDKVGVLQLRKDSPLLRCYCQECRTPLGADIRMAPVTLIPEALIRGTYSVTFVPTVVLGYREALPGTKPYCRTMVVRARNYGLVFLVKVVARVILGFMLGNKSQGGLLENRYDNIAAKDEGGDDIIPIGLNHLYKNKKKDE